MSTLKVNTIQDTSGGSSSTPAQIEQGRAKLWVRWTSIGTLTIKDSYNVTSVTDNGTGDFTVNYAITMANANYFTASMERMNSRTQGAADNDDITTTTFRWRSYDGGGTQTDRHVGGLIVFGDL